MPSDDRAFRAEVVVAGAGPVGLAAALLLAQAGVRVRLLEKRPGLSAASLASTLHPPTLELLDRLGVLPAVRHLGAVAGTIQHRTQAGVFAEFPMRCLEAETRFPFRLHLEQARIAPVMLARLQALPNARVSFNREVLDVAHQPGGVAITVAGPDGTERLDAPCLLAADGARSAVREALGIGFDGSAYPGKVLRVMTDEDLDPLLPGIAPVTYVHNGGQTASFLRMAECWRIILRVPEGTPDEEAEDEGAILARLQAVLPGCRRLPRVVAKDVYGASRRVASAVRQGRVFLLGDAAHVTSTRGGMNMNCGLHDAAALAPAIAAAITSGTAEGWAAAERVSELRRTVATDKLLPRTDRSVSGGTAWMEALRAAARDPAASAAYLRTAAMLDMLDGVPGHG